MLPQRQSIVGRVDLRPVAQEGLIRLSSQLAVVLACRTDDVKWKHNSTYSGDSNVRFVEGSLAVGAQNNRPPAHADGMDVPGRLEAGQSLDSLASPIRSVAPADLDLVSPEALGRRRLLKRRALAHPVLEQTCLGNHEAVVDAKSARW